MQEGYDGEPNATAYQMNAQELSGKERPSEMAGNTKPAGQGYEYYGASKPPVGGQPHEPQELEAR